MSNWRVAKSLLQLRKQINDLFPSRNKDWDGTIGDASHQTRDSDHNPWVQNFGVGIVTAMDVTNDPKNGTASEALAQALIASKDPRIKYIISNRRIYSGTDQGHAPWEGRPYSGQNPHDHHVHISVKADATLYDDERPWDLSQLSKVPAAKPDETPEFTLVQRGSSGESVAEVQDAILKSERNSAGPMTDALVRAYQKEHGLVPDGKVGPQTWKKLKGLT